MDALIWVDLQNDFMPGGSLAVPDGDRTVPVANALAPHFSKVVATLDCHPPNHCSFASNRQGKSPGQIVRAGNADQVLWPDHCVEGTPGFQLHPDLNRDAVNHEIRKGTNPAVDSYSGFLENDRKTKTPLDALLKSEGVNRIFVMGLATDYCVKFTALDGIEMGYEVFLIKDGCRAVNLNPGDGETAVEEMRRKGVKGVESSEIEKMTKK